MKSNIDTSRHWPGQSHDSGVKFNHASQIHDLKTKTGNLNNVRVTEKINYHRGGLLMNDTVQRAVRSNITISSHKETKKKKTYCGRTSCGAAGLTQKDQRRALKSVSSLGLGRDVALRVEIHSVWACRLPSGVFTACCSFTQPNEDTLESKGVDVVPCSVKVFCIIRPPQISGLPSLYGNRWCFVVFVLSPPSFFLEDRVTLSKISNRTSPKRTVFAFRPGAALTSLEWRFSKPISQNSEFKSQRCSGLARLATWPSSFLSVEQHGGTVITVTDLPWSRRFASQNNRRGIRITNLYHFSGADGDRNWNRLARDGPCDTSTTVPSPPPCSPPTSPPSH